MASRAKKIMREDNRQTTPGTDPAILTAVNLKQQLWETLQGVRDGSIAAGSADSVASQAREILRTVRTQLAIFDQASLCVSDELIDFAKPNK